MLEFRRLDLCWLLVTPAFRRKIVIGVYVGDIVLTGKGEKTSHAFKVKDMGELHYFLGVKNHKNGQIWIESVLQKYGMEDAKPDFTPAEANSQLVKMWNIKFWSKTVPVSNWQSSVPISEDRTR